MAIHGKTARLWIDQFELTSYFNDFVMNAKATTADATVFGKGAKTFIGGLKEGQISAKGFYDSAAAGSDQELANALGRSTNMVVTFSPNGGVTQGSRAVVSSAAETDYTVTAPVANTVGVAMTAQADSGLSTGVVLFDPTVVLSAAPPVTTGTASTTVAAGSNTVNTNTFTGSGTLNVAATAGFQSAGAIIVATGTTPAYITYTGTTGTTFTGCTTVSGGGVLSTGGTVNVGLVDAAAATTGGFVACLHVLTLTGTGTPTIIAKVQHSADGVTWADLTSFNGGNTIGAVGAYAAFVAYGTVINKFLRAVHTTAGTTISTTSMISAARQ